MSWFSVLDQVFTARKVDVTSQTRQQLWNVQHRSYLDPVRSLGTSPEFQLPSLAICGAEQKLPQTQQPLSSLQIWLGSVHGEAQYWIFSPFFQTTFSRFDLGVTWKTTSSVLSVERKFA